MKRPRPRIWIAGAIALGFALSGCSSPSGEAIREPHPTLIEVDPDVFLGTVPCSEEPGALRTYVATLFDMTPFGAGAEGSGEPSFVRLPSSAPVSCRRSLAFGLVVPYHQYAARIEGYERSDLQPAASGVPVLIDPATGEPVTPDWTTECGAPPPLDGSAPNPDEGTARVTSISQVTRKVGPCEPLVRTGPDTPTAVEVGLDAETCSTLEVERFSVRRNGVDQGSALCGETIALSGVEPGQFVEVDVFAYAAGTDEPRFGTICTAKALAGVRVAAGCAELEPRGSIRVDVADVLEALGARCSDVVELVLSLAESSAEPAHLSRESCRGVVRFPDLTPGSYTVRAQSVLLVAPLARGASCGATVEPGLPSGVTCSPDEP